jgi:small subunit ribosomal protein S20
LPNIASSIRQLRTDAKRTTRNKSIRTGCKSSITKAEKHITSGEGDEAKAAAVTAISTLDKAAAKGIIHPNNAARRKARLAKKLNSLKK